jgi:hypothetical protein
MKTVTPPLPLVYPFTWFRFPEIRPAGLGAGDDLPFDDGRVYLKF